MLRPRCTQALRNIFVLRASALVTVEVPSPELQVETAQHVVDIALSVVGST